MSVAFSVTSSQFPVLVLSGHPSIRDTQTRHSRLVTGNWKLETVSYLTPTTIESGPTSGSTRVVANPASFIQPAQSAPV